jgi:hypothetical protein
LAARRIPSRIAERPERSASLADALDQIE